VVAAPPQATNPREQDIYDRSVRVQGERLTFHASLAASNAAGIWTSASRSVSSVVFRFTSGRCNLVMGPMIDEYTHDVKHLRPG
jgi:hypothetical protein